MKLVAIFSVWDDWDLLDHSVRNISPLVDGIIIVASNYSNYGELSPIPDWPHLKPFIYVREPQFKNDPRKSETDKRNHGLYIAKTLGYTHFLTMDADEFYEPEPFLKEKEKFLNPELRGLVCQCQTYFKSPKLTIGLDTTLIPFIHKLSPGIQHEFNKLYPFAWIDGKIRIDPTRSLNINSGVERNDLIMHHLSFVRSDLMKKIRNSTAKSNLEKSTIIEDYRNAKDGYYCKYYQKMIVETPNLFGIPENIADLNV